MSGTGTSAHLFCICNCIFFVCFIYSIVQNDYNNSTFKNVCIGVGLKKTHIGRTPETSVL